MRKPRFKDLRRVSQVYISTVIENLNSEPNVSCSLMLRVKMLVLKKKKKACLTCKNKQTKADEKDTHSRLC